ncbi:pseudouridine synthase [bacterium endosymbiont of Pedicinus badii]|uniref:pseudouridine synthase n=1 Tax=bacterium endosymbiont of Pedicinus badii TaxID=1719126 RepID=UPI0009BAB15C|nr:pseudouridine synthase [bacterium endosymbiont of Pedicinus badii]OQM34255.1 hypothetical protein AOQ89_02910 [bacterium endosymbiont of Pedicinus badii]
MIVDERGKMGITQYRIVQKFKFYTHIKIRILTGRTHQIRVHMKYIAHPIIGDQLYGNKQFTINKPISDILKKKILLFSRQALHASYLEFFHPKKKTKLQFYSRIPKDMEEILNFLQKEV